MTTKPLKRPRDPICPQPHLELLRIHLDYLTEQDLRQADCGGAAELR